MLARRRRTEGGTGATYTERVVREAPPGIERRPVTSASRVLLGGPVALVTAYDRGHANVLPIAWHTPLSANPPLVGIAIEQSRHSADVIGHSEQFAINIPARRLLHHVQYLGGLTGARVDKFEVTQLETFTATHVDAPLLTGCLAWVECEVRQVVPLGDHLLFVGLVVAVHVDPTAFDDRWLLQSPDQRPLQFLGDHYYSVMDGVIEARMPGSSDAPERVLQDRMDEDLELTHEAQERRADAVGQLQREVDAGNVVDISQLGGASGVPWAPPPGFRLPELPPRP